MRLLLSLVTSAAIALSGCASAPAAAPVPVAQASTTLGQYHWRLSRAVDQSGNTIEALFARPDKPLQLDFQNGHVHVANACNLMNGKAVIHDDTLKVTQLIHTMMACMNPAINGLDRAISSRLEQTDTFALNTDTVPPTLTLITPSKDTLVFTGTSRQH